MIIKILKIDDNIKWCDLKKYMPLLTIERQNKCKRYINEKDKIISLLTELFICSQIGSGKRIEFIYNQYGKPYIANMDNKYFSISHSKDCIAFIEDNMEIGIDIEYIREFNMKIIKKFFTVEEQGLLENSEDKNYTGYMLWTKKEALLKRNGTGFSAGGFKVNSLDKELCKYMYTTKVDDYMVSVCASKTIDEIDICEIDIDEILNCYQ